MKNFYLITCLILASPIIVTAQKKADNQAKQAVQSSTTTKPAGFELQQRVFRTAIKYNDGIAARQALLTMMSIDTADHTLKDSLAIVYFNTNAFAQSLFVTRDILASTPDNMAMLEIKTISEQSLGLLKESLEGYEKLFNKSKNYAYLYESAVLQFQLKRFGECKQSSSQILAASETEKLQVSLNVSQNQSQKVLMRAATNNLLGIMAMEIKDMKSAKLYFSDALKLDPNFVLAKNNLALVSKSNGNAASK